MPTAEANGQTLYYEIHGEGEPLLCVMGLTADRLAWALNTTAFAERHKTVIFDNRDVGESSYAEGAYEIKDMAQDALALADALELDSFHLLGVSMGGAISQEIALAAPERVLTLTLAVTFGRAGKWARELARTWGARRLKLTDEEFMDELLLLNLSEEFYENDDAVAVAKQIARSNPHPQKPDGFIRQLEASSRHDALDRLGSLSMPTHVIGAEHDILVPVWKSKELAELIPGAKLSIIPGSPHGANTERAVDFNQLVLDFIAQEAPTTA